MHHSRSMREMRKCLQVVYTITQPNVDDDLLLIEDTTGSHSVYVEYVVSSSDNPHPQSDVAFNNYGKAASQSLIRTQAPNSALRSWPSKAVQTQSKSSATAR